MSNPYEDFKTKNGYVKYLCNKCRHEMGKFEVNDTKEVIELLMRNLGSKEKSTPAAFYCVNNKCERFGLLTKVAVI